MKKISGQMANLLDLPREALSRVPYITISGKEEILIESYKGIIEYSDDIMRINTSVGVIRIEGSNLNLKQIQAEGIKITGTIKKLEFIV